MASIYKVNETGSAAITGSMLVPGGEVYRLVSVTCKMSAAPTTSENFTVILDAQAGSEYDVTLYSVDLSAASTTSVVWFPDEYLYLEGGDAVDVAYTNTDLGTYGLQITMERVL